MEHRVKCVECSKVFSIFVDDLEAEKPYYCDVCLDKDEPDANSNDALQMKTQGI